MREIKILIALILIFNLNVNSQRNSNSKINTDEKFNVITPEIAHKLSYFINDVPRVYATCQDALMKNSDKPLSYSQVDMIISNLSSSYKNTTICLTSLYQSYGKEMMYFALKKYFISDEILLIEKFIDEIRRKDLSIQEEKEKELLLNLKKKISTGYIFKNDEVSKKPEIDFGFLNYNDVKTVIFPLELNSPKINAAFNIVVDTLGYVDLLNSEDTLKFSYEMKEIWDYFKKSIHKPALIKIGNTYTPVNSIVKIWISEERVQKNEIVAMLTFNKKNIDITSDNYNMDSDGGKWFKECILGCDEIMKLKTKVEIKAIPFNRQLILTDYRETEYYKLNDAFDVQYRPFSFTFKPEYRFVKK